MSLVVCNLPKAGLGNQLFPLLHAHVFARLNQLPLIVIGYHRLKVGPYLRKEKIKRKYHGYFKFQKSIFGETIDKVRINIAKRKLMQVNEPAVAKMNPADLRNKIFIFEKLPTYHDYFIHLKAHREMVKQILFSILNDWVLKQIAKARKPIIGVHIRMGDFRKLKAGEDFAKVGHVRTPETYFINCINSIRTLAGKNLPVSLFTDGYRNEFEQMFSLKEIAMIEGNPDIVDLLLLSESKIIVAATGSTFSYWAGFLADAPLIKHPEHIHAPYRPQELNQIYYEGPAVLTSSLLTGNIKNISAKNQTSND